MLSLKSMVAAEIEKGYNENTGPAKVCQDVILKAISFENEGVNLLVNSNEQMLVEKLRSLLKFGALSTRYKDFFDIYIFR